MLRLSRCIIEKVHDMAKMDVQAQTQACLQKQKKTQLCCVSAGASLIDMAKIDVQAQTQECLQKQKGPQVKVLRHECNGCAH